MAGPDPDRATTTLDLERVEAEVRRLGPWFHDLNLHGVRTAPDHPLGNFLQHLWATVEPVFPADMTGLSVLDIGCNGGFYSFQLARRGAEVVGIDHDSRYLAQARFAAEVQGLDVELRQLEVYDVARLSRRFDYVLFMGVLYHLRYPLLALDRVARLVEDTLVLQSMVRGPDWAGRRPEDAPISEIGMFDEPGFPGMYFIEHSYAGDPSNWWVPNEAGLQGMIRSAGLRIDRHSGPGIYICHPDPDFEPWGTAWR